MMTGGHLMSLPESRISLLVSCSYPSLSLLSASVTSGAPKLKHVEPKENAALTQAKLLKGIEGKHELAQYETLSHTHTQHADPTRGTRSWSRHTPPSFPFSHLLPLCLFVCCRCVFVCVASRPRVRV